MASRFFRGFSKVFKGPSNRDGFKSPTKYATIGGVKPKVSTKKSDQIKKSNRLIKKLDKTMKKDMSPKMRAEGEKLKKEVKDTQKKIYRSKFAMGGVTGAIDKLKGKDRGEQGRQRKDKKKRKISELEKVYGQVADRSRERLRKRGNITIADIEGKMKKDITEAGKAMGAYSIGGRAKKLFGGRIKKKKPETKEQKSIKEKIKPKKKKDRLEELRKELGMKKGGSALKPVDKQKNPGLAKLPTQVRNKMGYMKKGGQVRKFGRGKK